MALMKRGERTEWPDWSEWPEWFGTRRFGDWPTRLPSLFEGHPMKVEEFRDEDTMVIRVEMPGIDPEKDVEIVIDDDVLRVTAERREETKEEDKRSYRSEFHYGSFSRAVALPAGTSEEDVVATYNDGILEIRLPVSEEKAESRKIPISRG